MEKLRNPGVPLVGVVVVVVVVAPGAPVVVVVKGEVELDNWRGA
jgi:hypothetical protein